MRGLWGAWEMRDGRWKMENGGKRGEGGLYVACLACLLAVWLNYMGLMAANADHQSTSLWKRMSRGIRRTMVYGCGCSIIQLCQRECHTANNALSSTRPPQRIRPTPIRNSNPLITLPSHSRPHSQLRVNNIHNCPPRKISILASPNPSPNSQEREPLTSRFQTRPPNQKPINIPLLRQILTILLAHRPTVDNPRSLRRLLRHAVRQPFPDLGVHFLRLFRGCDFARSDGPTQSTKEKGISKQSSISGLF